MRRRWDNSLPFFFIFFYNFFFYNFIVPIGFLPCEIRVAFPGESQLRQSRATQLTVSCWVFWCLRNPPNSDINYGIFNVRTDVNACDCTRGCTDTSRESALKVDSGRKIAFRTGESNPRRRRAGPMLYQLSYSPTPMMQSLSASVDCGQFPAASPLEHTRRERE